ncbi:MAG: hypothetical protein ACRDOL_29160 [Streptosporangiaceae bacterium]
MSYDPRADDKLIACLLIRTWALATGRTLRSDVNPCELSAAELIDFWADDQTAGHCGQAAAFFPARPPASLAHP